MLCCFRSSILLTDFDSVPHIHSLYVAFVHHVLLSMFCCFRSNILLTDFDSVLTHSFTLGCFRAYVSSMPYHFRSNLLWTDLGFKPHTFTYFYIAFVDYVYA
jgi:hypothetical protein